MQTLSHLALPGHTVFFTVLLDQRGTDLLIRHLPALRASVSDVRRRHPFRIDAFVVLPDHLHAILTLPASDPDHGKRWRRIKTEFSRRVAIHPLQHNSHKPEGDSGLWQRGYWDHAIHNAEDMALHMAYCWGDPVRHGLVRRAQDWAASSIHRDIRDGRLWNGWVPPLVTGSFGERQDDLPSDITWDASRATNNTGTGAAVH